MAIVNVLLIILLEYYSMEMHNLWKVSFLFMVNAKHEHLVLNYFIWMGFSSNPCMFFLEYNPRDSEDHERIFFALTKKFFSLAGVDVKYLFYIYLANGIRWKVEDHGVPHQY